MRVGFGFAMLLLILSHVGQSAESSRRPIEVDDRFTLAGFGDVIISPDGKNVAYSEYRWQESTDDRKADLWVVPAVGGAPQRLTFDRSNYGTLRWSPDGEFLYFVCSKRRGNEKPPYDGSHQIWRLKLGESEPVAVTSIAGGIDNFELSADGRSIFYTTSKSEYEGAWAKMREKFAKQKYGTIKQPKTSIYRLDPASWRAAKLIDFDGAVVELASNGDGSRLAMVTGADGTVVTLEGKSYITMLDVASGATQAVPDDLWRERAPSPYGRLNHPTWSADGKSLAFACGYDAFPSEVFIATWTERDAAQPKVRKIARPGDVSLAGGVDGGTVLRWRGTSNTICYLGDDHGRVRVYSVADADTDPQPAETLTPGDVCVENFTWDANGRHAAINLARPTQMYDLALLSDGGKLKQLTEVNPQTKDWALPQVSIFQWKGRDGRPVEGILELPADYKTGDRLPLIVSIHGGPTAMSRYHLALGLNGTSLLASHGYALLLPNYRGSTGYGDSFITELVGHANDIDVDDVLRGVDALVDAGIANQDHMGVCGWSNGGFLTNCIIAKTNRFQAASSGAGIADWTLEWGSNDEPGYATIFFGGPPWKATDQFRRSSPIFDIGNARTPTLIHVGENDPRCPKGNSLMIHRALREHCGVPTELVIYPGEGHGLNGYVSQKAKLNWDLEWFERYVKGKP
ncbi:MAG: S9 family peptidase [Pirellulales bacterium]|nr:S9 family peptidase [Pirellulales bacterium]